MMDLKRLMECLALRVRWNLEFKARFPTDIYTNKNWLDYIFHREEYK